MKEALLPIVDLYEEVGQLVRQIPQGKVSTARMISEALGDIAAVRAVSDIVRTQQVSRLFPFHRVVSETGRPFGDQGIVERNLKVLGGEGVATCGNMVSSVKTCLFKSFNTEHPLRSLGQLQEKLSSMVHLEDVNQGVTGIVAGVDVAYEKDRAFCCCVLMDRGFRILEQKASESEVRFPYISSYLAFREGPVILKALRRLGESFDALMLNGHGIAHPRGCGLASHVGLVMGKPTLGVTTRKLVGEEVPRGDSRTLIELDGRIVGAKIERRDFSPIYVSPGANITLEKSLVLVQAFLRRHRMPEPLWQAHNGARRLLTGR